MATGGEDAIMMDLVEELSAELKLVLTSVGLVSQERYTIENVYINREKCFIGDHFCP